MARVIVIIIVSIGKHFIITNVDTMAGNVVVVFVNVVIIDRAISFLLKPI